MTVNHIMQTLTNWQEVYSSFVPESLSDAVKCINEFIRICEGKRLVLWGANMHGNTLHRLFSDIGLKVSAFLDRNHKEILTLNGIEVYPPQWLSTLSGDDNIVLIASVNNKNFLSVKKNLEEIAPSLYLHNGYLLHYPLQSAACFLKVEKNKLEIQNCSSCTKSYHTCPILRKYLIDNNTECINKGGAGITLISCILGTICSLKCKHCAEHVPYIVEINKRFMPKNEIMHDIYTLARAGEFITAVEFLGGEPFLHPELAEIIEETREIENIGIINVFTNGTIMPSKALLRQLSKKNVIITFGNYTNNLSPKRQVRINETESVLMESGIKMFNIKNFTWFDTLSFERVEDNETMLEERYRNCFFRDCYRLYDGKLFHCMHHYAGFVTNNLPIDDSVVHIHEQPMGEVSLIDRLNRFTSLPYIEACRYCEMPYKSMTVSSGIQL